MIKHVYSAYVKYWVCLLVFAACATFTATAQEAPGTGAVDAGGSEFTEEEQSSEFVTINVKNANISEVLKAYSLQTGQSIVVGPDVVSDNVNVRLNNIPWADALDVILKPYGFGYRVVGDTIVISKLENIITVEGIEPLVSKVFNLGFCDAYDIKEIVEAQLTERGKYTILETKGLPGWEFGGDGQNGAAVESGVRNRKQREQIQKSKTFVVSDVPSAITRIGTIIKEIDLMPQQVLIEAKFLEISSGGLSDIGLDYIQGLENVEDYTDGGGSLTVSPVDQVLKLLNPSTGYPNPLATAAAGGYSQDSGISLSHSVLDDWGAEMAFAFIVNDDDSNLLSSPKILTLNNQEAAILVGQKYPIIDSQNNSSGGSAITSTSLDYYENIGIQLNVIPQVCADNYINMVVHPAVSEIESFEAGTVTAGTGVQSGTRYPILKIREAETQIMLKSHNTAVIGGLQTERDKETVKKVPFLGDIPFIGRLFRRETITSEKIDLLIFIKASIVEPVEYEAASARQEKMRQARMDLEILKENEDADFSEASRIDDVVTAENAVAALDEGVENDTDGENAEILALVQSMDNTSSSNAAAAKQ
jgi:type II secretory pathway component GspD/PulD (secretin)